MVMNVAAKKNDIELSKMWGIMGILPPLAVLMIVIQCVKSRKITFWSALMVIAGILYTAAIVLQVLKQS
jgi:hypothetical protein